MSSLIKTLYVFPNERSIVDRERARNAYGERGGRVGGGGLRGQGVLNMGRHHAHWVVKACMTYASLNG
jgi:hypothetical protein